MEPKMLEDVNTAILALSEAKTLVGQRLRLVRMLSGQSLRTVARSIGVSAPYLSYIEAGKQMPIERLIQLCGLYGVNWIELASQPKDSLSLFGAPVDSLMEGESEHAA